MTKTVAEMTVEEALEFAVKAYLEQGWDSTYYNSWREFVVSEGQDEGFEDSEWYSFLEEGGMWNAFECYTNLTKSYVVDGITVKYEGDQASGVAQSNSAYYVIFSLEDSTGKRYFKRDGYYNSYEGGDLAGAENSEVFPQEKVVTVWKDAQ